MSELAVYNYDCGFWEQPNDRVQVNSFSLGIPNIIVNTDRLSRRARNLLGENGCKRFSEFLQYKDCWDDSGGRKLSLRSVAMMNYFLSKYDKFASEPSLFLTREGNLQLGWEDIHGKAIEIEFEPTGITFYIESSDIEDHFSLEENRWVGGDVSDPLISQLESIN